ncbi:MAG: GTPase [Candidatus Nanoarchaeia archaeon]
MANTLGKAKKQRGKSNSTNRHKQPIPLMINDIIEQSDLILEVLDARFIEKTRHKEIEKRIEGMEKRIIFVLNKSDLVNVREINRQLEIEDIKPHIFFSSRERKGTAILRNYIKKEAKKIKKDAVNVGVIGYPNTGKSSLINVLIGKPSAKVSSIAGFTKSIQKIKLSKGIYLIDTPGIITPEEQLSGNRENSIRNSQIGAIDWNRIKEPDIVVNSLVKEYPGILEKYYNINAKGDSETLLEMLGRRLNYLKRNNIVDETRTAKHILREWQEGKIRLERF